jgi:AcrR family transcriptional regulator
VTQPSRPEPLTARGRRTREALLDAGRQVLETRGYNATTADDIADAAGVSHGTFYTWFSDKDALMRALVETRLADAQQAFHVPDTITDPVERITEANRRYLTTFATYARLYQVLEEVATIDPYYNNMLISLRSEYVRRISTTISRLQADRLVDSTLDAHVTASALSAMVEGFARHWLGRGEEHDAELAVTTLSRLWVRALGLGDLPQYSQEAPDVATHV